MATSDKKVKEGASSFHTRAKTKQETPSKVKEDSIHQIDELLYESYKDELKARLSVKDLQFEDFNKIKQVEESLK
jgi:hypothetical protein